MKKLKSQPPFKVKDRRGSGEHTMEKNMHAKMFDRVEARI
jgi:hypothetical protein